MAEAPLQRRMITGSVMLATLMQAVDTTIANVALPSMQGSLSATQDQISWVLTSYIVATAIMTPPTGFLAERFGRKKLFLAAVIGFTVSSVLCGLAQNLEQMVLFRVLQGAFGAPLIPLSQAVLLDSYPPEQHGSAMALWGVGVMVGPVLGPTLGGWLSEYYDWRWVFLINLPFGVLAWLGISACVAETPRKQRRFDLFGFTLLTLAIGALQMMLDRGELAGWFESTEIVLEAALAAAFGYMFLVHMLTHPQPFLSPAIFRDRNLVTCLVLIFAVGVIMLATMALLPPFLQNLIGYPAVTTGLLLAPRGMGTMIGMLLVGRLIGRVSPRLLLLLGLSLVAGMLWEMSHFTDEVSRFALVWTGLVQGIGLGLLFVPLSTVAFSTLAPALRTEATSMYSLMRNIGGSIGISIVTAQLARGTQAHRAVLAEHVNPLNPRLDEALLPLAGQLSESAQLALLDTELNRQAALLAYLGDFELVMVITLATMPLLLLLRQPKPKAVAISRQTEPEELEAASPPALPQPRS